jgi:hypothetical protein
MEQGRGEIEMEKKKIGWNSSLPLKWNNLRLGGTPDEMLDDLEDLVTLEW